MEKRKKRNWPLSRLFSDKRGVVGYYITFFIVAIIVVTIAAVLAPMGVLFNTKMYAAGEDILLLANESIADINDATVRASIYNVTNTAFSASQTNIEVNADIFQYGWVLIIVLVGLVIFLFSRRTVEYSGGFI